MEANGNLRVLTSAADEVQSAPPAENPVITLRLGL
jgi:hypothetical protein